MQKFKLTNLQNGKTYYFEAEDARKAIIDMRFMLDMGMYSNEELQKDYSEMGLEIFRFDIC